MGISSPVILGPWMIRVHSTIDRDEATLGMPLCGARVLHTRVRDTSLPRILYEGCAMVSSGL